MLKATRAIKIRLGNSDQNRSAREKPRKPLIGYSTPKSTVGNRIHPKKVQ